MGEAVDAEMLAMLDLVVDVEAVAAEAFEERKAAVDARCEGCGIGPGDGLGFRTLHDGASNRFLGVAKRVRMRIEPREHCGKHGVRVAVELIAKERWRDRNVPGFVHHVTGEVVVGGGDGDGGAAHPQARQDPPLATSGSIVTAMPID